MSGTDLIALAPLLILAITAVVVMLVVAFYRRHVFVLSLTLFGLGVAFLSLFFASGGLPRSVTALFRVDIYAYCFMGLIFASTAIVAVFSHGFLRRTENLNKEEFYILLLLSAVGASTLVLSSHFASFFLGLEILSVTLYAMIAYMREDRHRLEASIKYLILGGATSASLLFGMALIYAEFGTMSFEGLRTEIADMGTASGLLWIGTGMLIIGVGFKLALVPFHMWTPDVYQGAPAPVTGYLASVSKAAMFALALRYFTDTNLQAGGPLWAVFGAISVASILTGNIMAVIQDDLKRLLAYSSIAHMGYVLVAFLGSGPSAQPAVIFYLIVYSITTLVAFGVISMLSEPHEEREALDQYQGLFWERPGLSLALAASLLSLAGLPPMAGLISKIYVAVAGVESSLWVLLGTLVAGSVIGVYYYVRVLVGLFRQPEEEAELRQISPSTFASRVALTLLSGLLILFGLYPTPLLRFINGLVQF
jgi:NADH-quinone oxidoreductase subunit N